MPRSVTALNSGVATRNRRPAASRGGNGPFSIYRSTPIPSGRRIESKSPILSFRTV